MVLVPLHSRPSSCYSEFSILQILDAYLTVSGFLACIHIFFTIESSMAILLIIGIACHTLLTTQIHVNTRMGIKYDNPSAASGLCKFGSLTPLPSTLISQITRYADCKPVQFNCRVNTLKSINFCDVLVGYSNVSSKSLISSDLAVNLDRLSLFIFLCWSKI